MSVCLSFLMTPKIITSLKGSVRSLRETPKNNDDDGDNDDYVVVVSPGHIDDGDNDDGDDDVVDDDDDVVVSPGQGRRVYCSHQRRTIRVT